MTTITRQFAESLSDDPGELPAETSAYRPFFLAGILTVLTAGCLLGAIALLGISRQESYLANAWTPYVLAHANSQLYGWVGFFVMGFSLQQHPPRRSRETLYRRLAHLCLGLLATAIVLRFVAEPLTRSAPGIGLPLGAISALLQGIAVLAFGANIGITRCRLRDAATGERSTLPWQSLFVFAALFWWSAVALAEPWIFFLSHRPDTVTSAAFVADWFVIYREAQFLGFVPMMIFGVALSRFAADLGLAAALRQPALLGFLLWNGGLILRMGGWRHYVVSGMAPSAAGGYHVGGAMLAVAALLLIASLRLFERTVRQDPTGHGIRTLALLRAAFGWLLLVGVLLLLEPEHLRRTGAPFSHAYTGAIRHALTVGFISQTILGVAAYIAPRWRSGRPDTALPSLLLPFLLLNTGNALRVGCEIATDYTRAAFPLMGLTGFIELLALLLWAAALVPALRPAETRSAQTRN